MKHHATAPAPGEHLIAYAYPSSPRACRLHRGRTGCYVVQTFSAEVPMETFDAAVRHAKALGTAPQRWSMDHPSNAHFLSERDRAFATSAATSHAA